MSNRRDKGSEVQTVTSVAVPLGDDIDRRARRYLIQMALRTLCFMAAVALWGRVPTWVAVSLLVGAVILPYVAVVLANAGRERPERPEEVLLQRRLGAAAAGAGAGAATPWPDAVGVPTAGPARPADPHRTYPYPAASPTAASPTAAAPAPTEGPRP